MSNDVIPKYIQALLDEIIEEYGFRDYSLQLKQGSQVGDGFLSELSCINILENGSDKHLDLVCKIAPLNAIRRKEFLSNVIFGRESYFYNKVMPTFLKFQEIKNVPKGDQFCSIPKCYAAITDDKSEQHVIIMEDLRPHGFKMWNKAKTTPIENMRLAMRELGKFHGISIALKNQQPEQFAEFKQLTDISQTFFESQYIQGMFDASFDRAIKALKNEEHKNIMRTLKSNISGYFQCCLKEKISNRFGVVSHGAHFTSFSHIFSFLLFPFSITNLIHIFR